MQSLSLFLIKLETVDSLKTAFNFLEFVCVTWTSSDHKFASKSLLLMVEDVIQFFDSILHP